MLSQAVPLKIMIAQEDEALARQAAHDPQAFSELYQRYFESVYRFHLARTGEVAEAQDLTSQTWMSALEGIGGYRGSGSFAAWLFGIARRKQAQLYRLHRESLDLEQAESLADSGGSPEIHAGQRLELAQVSRFLKRLSLERADAVVLCLYAGLNASEAAQVMGKSEAAVKMLLLRGVRDLRGYLSSSTREEK